MYGVLRKALDENLNKLESELMKEMQDRKASIWTEYLEAVTKVQEMCPHLKTRKETYFDHHSSEQWEIYCCECGKLLGRE